MRFVCTFGLKYICFARALTRISLSLRLEVVSSVGSLFLDLHLSLILSITLVGFNWTLSFHHSLFVLCRLRDPFLQDRSCVSCLRRRRLHLGEQSHAPSIRTHLKLSFTVLESFFCISFPILCTTFLNFSARGVRN